MTLLVLNLTCLKEKIDSMLAFRNHVLKTPKYGNLSSFPTSSFDILKLLNHQGLGILISYFGLCFPYLVQTFYCNISISTWCIVKSCVKGNDIVLSMEDFGRCLDVSFEGDKFVKVLLMTWLTVRKIDTIIT